MADSAYANPSHLFGPPNPWASPTRRGSLDGRSVFGDIALVAFLLAQCFDGVFTYIGVVTYGAGIEANPLIASLMDIFGHGVALTGAKVVAGVLGICLHLWQIHIAVAVLSAFYVVAAIVPWMMILFG